MKLINKLSKKHKRILLIISLILLLISIILVGYKVCTKYIFKDKDEEIKPVLKEEIELENENYKYYLSGNATEYQKKLSDELKKVLSEETVNEEEYAKILSKLFVSDLFTLNNKENSSDVTSNQYVYTSYQETYTTMVKNTIYANIELNINNKRTQNLPTVTDVEVTSVTKNSFKYNKQIIDQNAFYVTTKITYDKDLKYPTVYKLVIVKNNDLLQVAKAYEA